MRMLGRRADLHAVIADAEAAGRSVRLVVGGMDKLSVLTAFADAIGAPSWFGKNYDALTDALQGSRGRRRADHRDHLGRGCRPAQHGTSPRTWPSASCCGRSTRSGPDLTVTIVDR
jgi:hypothetical protein